MVTTQTFQLSVKHYPKALVPSQVLVTHDGAYLLDCSYLICCWRKMAFFSNSCTLAKRDEALSIPWTVLEEG